MSNSKQLQIRAAVATIMASVAEGRVYENRDFNLAQGKDSQVHVNFRRSTPDKSSMQYAGHPIDWGTEIEIKVLTRKTDAGEASDLADAIWVDIFGLVMADQTLGGLVAYLDIAEAEIEDAEADTSTCRLTWSFTAQHRTDSNSIAST